MKVKIKTKVSDVLKVWKEVFSKTRYIIFAIIFALIFYILDIFFANFKSLITLIKIKGIFAMLLSLPSFMWGYPEFFPKDFFVGLVILSLLFGVFFSLIIYKTKTVKSAIGKGGVLASIGVFLGILSPSCSVYCGIGILSTIGISTAFINFLPLRGFELIILSTIIILISIYSISVQINKGIVCEVPIAIDKKKAG